MSTITPNLTLNCAIALSYSLYKADAKYLDTSIRSVVQVLPRTPLVMLKNDSDSDVNTNERCTFRDMFKMSITYVLWNELTVFQSEQVTDTTTYRFLHAALFSASAVKNGLLDADFIYVFTRFGLLLSDFEALEDDRKKVAALRAGACLQLITAGSVFMVKHFAETDSPADVKAALEKLITVLEGLRLKRLIAHPQGQELLEVGLFKLSSSLTNFHTRKP
jgi:hypothetical protein